MKKNYAAKFSKHKQQGFIITLELLLIVTILVLGTLGGVIAIRDALVKHYSNQQAQKTLVVDDNGAVLGEAVDYDEHDAPRIFYIDRTLEQNYRVLIGVRDDRFTSREPIYYSGSQCSGDPCIKSISDEATDSQGIDSLPGTGSVSYFNALQGQPNYAIGRGDEGLQGFLYRESIQQCPVNSSEIGSRWLSQKVVSGEPCEEYSAESSGTSAAYADCLIDTGDDCQCPVNYLDQSDILSTYLPEIETQLFTVIASINNVLLPTGQQIEDVTIGTLCCPEASSLSGVDLVDAATYSIVNTLINDPNLQLNNGIKNRLDNIISPLQGELLCESLAQFKLAVSVPSANDPDKNALEPFLSPFWVNLPLDSSEDNWQSIAPTGE
ncbi:MAG: hypothetical protein ACJAU1_000034 [Psychromonas sp.]|jgi:hypothetical protein